MPDLAALARAATPGPWTVRPSRDLSLATAHDVGIVSEALPNEPGIRSPLIGEVFSERHRDHPDGAQAVADATYIAACSPERILALLAVVEAARGLREHLGVAPQYETVAWPVDNDGSSLNGGADVAAHRLAAALDALEAE